MIRVFRISRDYLGSRAYGYMELPNLRLACRRARTGQASQEAGMRLVVRLLGAEVFAIETGNDETDGERRGESTSYPIGFTQSHGDQRWERGAEFE